MPQENATAQHQPGDVEQPRGLWISLVALVLAMLLAQLDHLILSPAMPAIVGDLGGLAYLSWVTTAYSLTVSVVTPIWGKFGDMYGRKGAFMTSIGLFLGGSALSGLAQDMVQLIAFRVIQGLGAAGLMVGAFAILGTLVPGRDRGKYQGLFAGVMGVATVGGGPVGGLITESLGWRWAFYVNLPIGGVALLLSATCLRLPRNRLKARADYLGATLLGTSLASILLLSTWGGQQYSWTSPEILGLGTAFLVTGAWFLRVQQKKARGPRHARVPPEPLLSLALFRNVNFMLGTLLGFLVGVVLFGAMTYLPIFQQVAQGASPSQSGLLLLPISGAMTAVNVVVGQLISKTGKYKIFMVVGGMLVPLGMLLMAFMSADTPKVLSVTFMAVFGAGIGLLMQATMLISMEAVEPKDLGVASSTAVLARSVGGSVGAAVMGTIFTQRLTSRLESSGGSGAGELAGNGHQLDTSVVAKLPAELRELYESAVTSGMQLVFLVGAVIGLAIAVSAWFVHEVPLKGMGGSAKDEEDGGDASGSDGPAGQAETVRSTDAPEEPVPLPDGGGSGAAEDSAAAQEPAGQASSATTLSLRKAAPEEEQDEEHLFTGKGLPPGGDPEEPAIRRVPTPHP